MPKPPDPTDDDMTDALGALLPPGRVWPSGFDSIVRKTLAGLSPSFGRLTRRAGQLLIDAFPATAVELLGEWEKSLGLPDPCQGPAPTVLQRQQQVLARFAKSGGQSVDYFIQFAAALGYPITITEFAPYTFGRKFGDPFGGHDWAYTWQVNATLYGQQTFQFGANVFGDPFSTFGSDVLECELNRIKPAHTTLIFSYT